MVIEMKQVNIIDQNNEGDGLARIDNVVTFIPYGLKDDVVVAEITETLKRHNIGKIINIVKESKERTIPKCKYYYECGGCNLMHQDYVYQLEFKKRNVLNNIKKISNIEINSIDIISDNNFNYRNHIRLHLNKKEIGFYSNKTNNIIDIEECLIANNNINKIIKELRLFINAYKNHNIEEIDIKCYEESMINIKSDNFIYLKELIKYIDVDSIYLNDEFEYGKKNITAGIGNYKYFVSSKSFLQKNSNITKKMYDYIKSLIDSNKIVLDLYCGIGSISIYIANVCDKVYGVEIVKEAINNANNNLKLNNIDNVEFECNGVDNINDNYKDIDIIIVDPPRTGLNKKALDNILSINANKIIYVSCNSTSLARDLNILKEKYNLISIRLFDMFPNTNHVESVTLLEKYGR